MSTVVSFVSSVWTEAVRVTVLDFEAMPERPVSPAWIGWPFVERPHPGMEHAGTLQLHRLVARVGLRATFESDAPQDAALPAAGTRCNFYSWWDAEQLERIRDAARAWSLDEFRARPAIRYPSQDGGHVMRVLEPGEPVPAGASVVEGGWDHEHCMLCWQTISTFAGDERLAFHSLGDWLCTSCHGRILVPGAERRWGDQV